MKSSATVAQATRSKNGSKYLSVTTSTWGLDKTSEFLMYEYYTYQLKEEIKQPEHATYAPSFHYFKSLRLSSKKAAHTQFTFDICTGGGGN